MNDESFEVRDLRVKGWFRVDNKFLDEYSKYVKVYAAGVYFVLSRHANKEQKTWPSIRTIAEELSISVPMVDGAIWILELFNIIKKRRLGKKLCNRYWLIDKNQWLPLTIESVDKFLSDLNSMKLSDLNNVKLTIKQRLNHDLTTFKSLYSNKTNSNKTNKKGTEQGASPAYFKITDEEKKELALVAPSILKKFNVNIFIFISSIKKHTGYFPPIDKIIKIAKNALKANPEPENVWAYFIKALKVEMPKSFAQLRITEREEYKKHSGIPESMKDILRSALAPEKAEV